MEVGVHLARREKLHGLDTNSEQQRRYHPGTEAQNSHHPLVHYGAQGFAVVIFVQR